MWSALRSEPLQRALQGDSTPLAEVYLVVRDGDRFLEGYIDLLVAGPDDLSILDYKTDRVSNDAEADAKREHYTPQLAAYVQAWSGSRDAGRPARSSCSQ